MGFHVFNNDDGIIDYQTDSQYHGKQCQGVDTESQRHKAGKGADKGYGDSQHRNKRGPPALQKEEHDEDNQHQGFLKGIYYFRDGFVDILRTVDNGDKYQIIGEVLRGFIQYLFDFTDGFHGIGIIRQLDTKSGTGSTIGIGNHVRGLGTCFYTGHIPEKYIGAIRFGF